MKIVIVGEGKVGHTLAAQLSEEGHDIVVIDKNAQVLTESQEALDVIGVNGNGASLEIQRAADVGSADMLIAATSGDEVNLLCCVLARKLGCKHTIARVRNPEYEQQVRFLKEELGLSLTINPEKAAAREILRILQLPSFLKRDAFARGRVELVELKVKEGSPLVNVRLDRLGEVTRAQALICAVERGEEITIPKGSFVILEGDKLTISAPARDLGTLIKDFGIQQHRVQNVMIIGGSRIAAYLAKQLLDSRHVSVKILDHNMARCLELAEQLPGALVIHGDGAMQELLLSEGIEQTDAVVTLTGMDEENLILSMYANHIGVPKCITKINRTEYANMFRDKGIDTVISPKLLTANEIIRYVRAMSNTTGGSVITLHRIVDGKAEALEFRVTGKTWYRETPLYKLSLRDNILIVSIARRGQVILPRGGDVLREGDAVVVVTTAERAITDLNDIFTAPPEREE